jgi:nucleoside-diphosphate-sugar epimerase
MNIILLGGSKFMGLEVLKKLIESDNIKSIYVINRGNIYWNNKFNEIANKNVTHIKADRRDKENFKSTLSSIMEKVNIDFVIDFSCYKEKDLTGLLSLSDKFGKYIFISTDSTYNASELGLIRTKDFFFKEKDISLITEEEVKFIPENADKYKDRDDYGFNKLLCEFYISKTLPMDKYYFLRLPDVIGPFDDSYRPWYYLIWFKYDNLVPIELEEVDTVRKLSFVFSEDVAWFIIYILDNEINIKENIFNLACDENITLKEFIEYIGKKEINFKVIEDGAYAHTYLPSVTIGPISNERAKMLGFTFTNLFEALGKSVEFFKNAEVYEKEYNEMKADLPRAIRKIIEKENK